MEMQELHGSRGVTSPERVGRLVSLTIDAPGPWLNSNDRRHRLASAEIAKAWRAAGRLAAERAGWEPLTGVVHIVAHIYKPRAGRYDPNNLWPTIKAVVDGFVEAGLLADDDHKHVIGPDMRHGGKDEPCVAFVMTEVA
jgi:hypothetical protein